MRKWLAHISTRSALGAEGNDPTRNQGSVAVNTAVAEHLADSRLLDDCIEGNALAWRQLHRQYYPVAAAFLRKLGVRERDLDDASQEVFLQLFRYLPRFRREAEL